MAWMHIGVCLVMALCAAAQTKHCPNSVRIDWIPSQGIDVGEPWYSYKFPESGCCNKTDPENPFDAQEKCSLCYDLTHSTPGFAANPNNCQKFYMCEESNGPEKWIAYPMMCPNCTFWDQDKLTCVQVYDDPDHTGVCGIFSAVTPPLTLPTVVDDPKLFCIDFEDPYQLADYGIYVYNDGVELVDDASVCPKPGSQCGHFLGTDTSRLEVPFFSNNYDHFKALVITFYYRRTRPSGNEQYEQGIISNDCYPDGKKEGSIGNSLYCSINGSQVNAGMKEPSKDIYGNDDNYKNVYAKIKWENGLLSIVLKEDNKDGAVISASTPIIFQGPIRNSHCPMVIGSFIQETLTSFFEGYMDDICFYKYDSPASS